MIDIHCHPCQHYKTLTPQNEHLDQVLEILQILLLIAHIAELLQSPFCVIHLNLTYLYPEPIGLQYNSLHSRVLISMLKCFTIETKYEAYIKVN